MATKVVMAQLSPTMEEGRLVEWKLDEGDEVAQGDVVAEIETDKANMDVESMGEGVLRKRIVGEGQTVVVAAPNQDFGTGAVYVFERQGPGQWEQVARLRARKEGYVHKHFGSSVALSGDCLIAGSTYEDEGRGAAYVFCREAGGAWTLDERLVAGRRQGSSLFGEDVALDGDVALVGAPGEDREDGAAYLFERTPQGWVPFGQ